ncbi:hypothetical protein GQ55_2G118900 [Panicum hallii var. hallii]|uniref:Bifunctional inhibitor/plant lipid transfer protein/seed storage helical domain-containing protein n=1 Tax=Panicum hallii var. hallii TaxID=1504633 RepID=A0A2T7EP06_9POAL|nr:hypothetical protein GQ55_2G118900 [Panicum hallii var. hallii]
MAPSNKCTLVALLVAFAVVAPMLPPSAAARDGGAAKAAPAPAPPASGDVRLHPMGLIDDIIGFHIPDLPLPPILPCPPAFPIKIPFIPCRNVTPSPPPVTECRPGLAKYMPPCAGFLTSNDSSVSSPPSRCCDVIEPLFQDKSTSPLCLCHVVNGDAGKLLPAPVNHMRATSLLQQCGSEFTADNVTDICANRDNVFIIPPMDADPSPPQRRH